MPHRYSNRWIACLATAALTIVTTSSVQAGTATGAATEWTQLANNAQLVDLMKSSGIQVDNQLTQIGQLAEQIQNQLKIYENMLQNTAQLPDHVWGAGSKAISASLRSIVDQGQGHCLFDGAMPMTCCSSAFQKLLEPQDQLAGRDKFFGELQTWSDTNRDTIASTLKAASLTADQFDSEEGTMSSLRSMSETANGQMKALQVGHEIAAQQVAQMQKLRGLVSQQMTMMGTWLQIEQTDKDLAQARREKFFNAEVKSIPEGQKMEPRW